jgi:protein-L-isoaspartate(D-aspartate) O-methyltransferase
MNSNMELVDYLINDRKVLKTDVVIEAFKGVDRGDFFKGNLKRYAYEDSPFPIGPAQTISQPYTVAFMLELLQPKEDSVILDVGCGSCYTTALLAFMAKKGKVVGVEIEDSLVEFCKNNLSKYSFNNIEIHNANKVPECEDLLYDRILVSASAYVLPKELIDALKDDGIMVIPIRSSIFLIKKKNGQIFSREYPGFAFVELK